MPVNSTQPKRLSRVPLRVFGGGSTQQRTMRGVGWLIGLGRLAIGRRVRVCECVLWLSRGLQHHTWTPRVVLKVRSLRQEHSYCKETPTFCSAFGRAMSVFPYNMNVLAANCAYCKETPTFCSAFGRAMSPWPLWLHVVTGFGSYSCGVARAMRRANIADGQRWSLIVVGPQIR